MFVCRRPCFGQNQFTEAKQHKFDIVGINLQGCLIIAFNVNTKLAKGSNVLAEGTQMLLLCNKSDPVFKIRLEQYAEYKQHKLNKLLDPPWLLASSEVSLSPRCEGDCVIIDLAMRQRKRLHKKHSWISNYNPSLPQI